MGKLIIQLLIVYFFSTTIFSQTVIHSADFELGINGKAQYFSNRNNNYRSLIDKTSILDYRLVYSNFFNNTN